MSANSSSSTIRFGTFEVNSQTGELRKRGQKVKLQEQPLQVLVALLERPGELVTREELRSKLWPADTFVDFDHGLNAAVKRLRDVLGESADAPIFIETLARRGYRFVAPVSGSSVPGGIEIASVSKRDKLFFLTRWVAVLCLALILVAVVVWAPWRLASRSTDIVERRLTSNSSENWVSGASISPDGKNLAYSDNTGIYLKLIRTGETHSLQLPANFLAHMDDWFPDGSHLLISREDQPGKTSLWSISVFGGSSRHLADNAAGGSVSPDGSHVAFLRSDLTYDRYGREIWVMRSDGTDPVKVAGVVTGDPDDSRFGVPTWSPDAKRIAYIRARLSAANTVEVNEWQSGKAETIFSDSRLASVLHWLRDGRLVYALFDQGSLHDSSLWSASLQRSGNNSEPRKRIAQGNGQILQIAGSADGKALVFVRVIWTATTYIGTLAPDGKTLVEHQRLTLDDLDRVSFPTSWTPDSRAVLFSSDRNGTEEIFKQASDRPLAEILATSIDQLELPRLTPDGSEILYISTPRTASSDALSSIFAIPITGGTPRLVLKDMHISNVQCARSPSTVCLYSTSKGKTSETFHFDVRNGKGTTPPQIDAEGEWSLSPDGSQRALIAYGLNEGTIQLRSTSSGETRNLVIRGWSGLGNIDWSANGKSVLVVWRNHDKESTLLNITLDGKVSVVLRSSKWIGFAVPSPDGRRLAICEAANPTKNAWEIQGF